MITPRPGPPILIAFMRRVEGVRYSAYRDVGGVWTCGVGSTNGVTPSTVWNDAQVDQHLVDDLKVAQLRLQNVVGVEAIVRLNDYQYAALLSFVDNEGAKAGWGIWADVKHGRYDGVAKHLFDFERVGLDAHRLHNRRQAECDLWNGRDVLCKSFPITSP